MRRKIPIYRKRSNTELEDGYLTVTCARTRIIYVHQLLASVWLYALAINDYVHIVCALLNAHDPAPVTSTRPHQQDDLIRVKSKNDAQRILVPASCAATPGTHPQKALDGVSSLYAFIEKINFNRASLI